MDTKKKKKKKVPPNTQMDIKLNLTVVNNSFIKQRDKNENSRAVKNIFVL